MTTPKEPTQQETVPTESSEEGSAGTTVANSPSSEEIGGAKGPEPTRYGDWEKGGRCTDF